VKASLSKFLQWRLNLLLYEKLGSRVCFLYILILGKLYFFFNRKEKYKIEDAVGAAFEGRTSKSEIKSIKRSVLRGVIFHYYEKIFNAFSSAEKLRVFLRKNMKSKGITTIDEGLAAGRGVLLISAHFGGVEFTPGYLAARNYPVTVIARFSSDYLRTISINKARTFATKIIDADNTSNLVAAIGENLRENRIVITQCDEIDEWRFSRDHIHFMGKEIALDKTISVLTKRLNAATVFGIMHRARDDRYHFIVNPLNGGESEIPVPEQSRMGASALKLLEHYIYRYPEEWYQWKKFSDIGDVPVFRTRYQRKLSPPLLQPAMGKA
jgi:KDO2-lipid IV(A) lauroyltransferase